MYLEAGDACGRAYGQIFSGTAVAGSTIDFRPLVEAAKGAACRIHAAVQSHVDSSQLAEGTIEMMRGTTTNYWAQGADGLYLAQWFGDWPYEASFYENFRELPHPEVMGPKDKLYDVPS